MACREPLAPVGRSWRRRLRRRGWRRRLRAPLLGATALLLLGNDGLELDTLVRDFGIIAFGAEFEQQTDGRLHKWTGPIRYFMDVRAGQGDLYRRLTAEHIALLRELTGLEIVEVDTPTAANLVIVFDRGESLFATAEGYAPNLAHDKRLLRQALCFGQFFHKTSGEIVKGVIGIPSDWAPSAGKLPHCIVEETTQLLGLPNDSDEVTPSIFDDMSVLDYLSTHDQVLVRLLYDRRLAPGMQREEALAIARRILREQGY